MQRVEQWLRTSEPGDDPGRLTVAALLAELIETRRQRDEALQLAQLQKTALEKIREAANHALGVGPGPPDPPVALKAVDNLQTAYTELRAAS